MLHIQSRPTLSSKKSFLEATVQWTDARIFISLVVLFLAFYAAQIPLSTSNADVLVYSLRASTHLPIVSYAFLDHRSLALLGLEPLPNYHLAHTMLLWAVYHLAPGGWRESIGPSGLVSSVSGALTVGLTFLIWARLGMRREVALVTSILTGLVPSIWYHSLIGEIYALQLCLSLLFVYLFLSHRLLLAGAAFLSANLVTPLSGLAATCVFLKSRDLDGVRRLFIVGLIALATYFLIFGILGVEILRIFDVGAGSGVGRSAFRRVLKFSEIILLNMHFLTPFVIWGMYICWREHRNIFYGLLLGAAPQVFVALLIDGGLLCEGGSFLLLFFWILCLPAAVALYRIRHTRYALAVAILAAAVVTHVLWVIPSEADGRERQEIGVQLRNSANGDLKVIGEWTVGIGVTLGLVGWDFNAISAHYLEKTYPMEESALLRTDEKSGILVEGLRPAMGLARWYGRIGLTESMGSGRDIVASFRKSGLKMLHESEGMRVYRWDRHPAPPSEGSR